MRSYDLTPAPPPSFHSSVSNLSLFLNLLVCCRSNLPYSIGGEGVGKEPNYTTARKPGPLSVIQYSLTHGKDLHFLLMIRVNTGSAEMKFIPVS
jgi:hypothetical protein